MRSYWLKHNFQMQQIELFNKDSAWNGTLDIFSRNLWRSRAENKAIDAIMSNVTLSNIFIIIIQLSH